LADLVHGRKNIGEGMFPKPSIFKRVKKQEMKIKHFLILSCLNNLIIVKTAPLIRLNNTTRISEKALPSAAAVREVHLDDDSINPFEYLLARKLNQSLIQPIDNTKLLNGNESTGTDVEIMSGKKKGKGDFVELMYPVRIGERALRRFTHVIKFLFLERTLDDGMIVAEQAWRSMKEAVNFYKKRQVFQEDSNVFHDIGVIVDFTHRVAQRRLSCFKFAFGKVVKNTQYHLSSGETVDDITLIPPFVRVKKFFNTFLLPGDIRQYIAVVPSKYGLYVTVITSGQMGGGDIHDSFEYTIPNFLDSISQVFDAFF
jgi:hypothetical protein